MHDLPESYRYYRADPANRAALDLIMASNQLPKGFIMAEWPTYYQVRLAAERVRTDFYEFVHKLWADTWGKELARHLPELELLRSGDDGDLDPSLDQVWEDRTIGNFIRLPDDCWFCVEAGVPSDRYPCLSFYLEDGDGFDWSDNVTLSAPWLAVDDDNWRRTKALPLEPNVASINIQSLTAAAAEVIERLTNRLR